MGITYSIYEYEFSINMVKRKVTKIIDGDTFKIDRPARGSNYIRISDKDAPEKGQRGFATAKNNLDKKIGLHPKRKTLAVIGFALIFVGVTMYSIGIFGIIQIQINQIGEEFAPPKISYHMLILFGIPIALVGIPVILHGLIQRFSIMVTVDVIRCDSLVGHVNLIWGELENGN